MTTPLTCFTNRMDKIEQVSNSLLLASAPAAGEVFGRFRDTRERIGFHLVRDCTARGQAGRAVVALAFCFPSGETILLRGEGARDSLTELLKGLSKACWAGFGLRESLRWIRENFGFCPADCFCIETASALLQAGTGVSPCLEQLFKEQLGLPIPPTQNPEWDGLFEPVEEIQRICLIAKHLPALAGKMESALRSPDLEQVAGLEMKLLPVVVEMIATGFPVRKELFADQLHEAESAMEMNEKQIRAQLGAPGLNIASSKQLLSALRNIGLKIASTSEEVLLALDHPVAAAILRYRAASGQSKQADSFLQKIGGDGRIHADFDPMGAVTGRFVCSDPNLQAVKRGKMREAFVAPPGHRLIVADYSQIELRAAAALAPDKAMLETFQQNGDIHTKTAALIKECRENEVNDNDRQLAKACNFGLIYGMSADGLANYARGSYGVEISSEEAENLRGKFFKTYSGLKEWHERIWVKIHAKGTDVEDEVRTIFKRRRLIPASSSGWERFTTMSNTLIQGTTADGLKLAMVRISRELPASVHLIATVHDEIICAAPEAGAEAAMHSIRQIMIEEMSNLLPEVPVDVKATITLHWGGK